MFGKAVQDTLKTAEEVVGGGEGAAEGYIHDYLRRGGGAGVGFLGTTHNATSPHGHIALNVC